MVRVSLVVLRALSFACAAAEHGHRALSTAGRAAGPGVGRGRPERGLTPSGVPRRATFFAGTADRYETSLAGEYILDRASFDPAQQGGNEFIVGNWTPIGVALAKPVREIMFNQAMGDMYTGVKEAEIGGYIAAAESTGLPWTSEEDEFHVRLWKDRVGTTVK
jgi:hypothetical protein